MKQLPCRKILVVDDEQDMAFLIPQIFRNQVKKKEMQFFFAADGLEALTVLEQEKGIELALVDINMPRMDGLTLLERMSTLHGIVKTIIISAYSDMKNIRRAMHRGASDFLMKPMDMDDLTLTVTRCLQEVKEAKKVRMLQEERDQFEAEMKAKEQLLGNVSHDIRTPLHAIVNATDILLETALIPEQKTYLSIIDASSNILLDLINNVLDLSKIEAGKLSLHQRRFHLTRFIKELQHVMELSSTAKEIKFSATSDSTLPEYVLGDHIRLRQILINLVGNAIKFTEEGNVTLCVSREKDGIKFCVSDTGIGIPEDHLDSIFEAFTQVENFKYQKLEGTGLGLAICHRLVQAMGGNLEVKSVLGKGSSFYFTLHFDTSATEVYSQRHHAKPHNSDEKQSGTILIVDDSKHNRHLLEVQLVHAGYHVRCAENGLIACRLAQREAYDLILMDMQMPVMDGYQATQAIRTWEKKHKKNRLPIIGITAAAQTKETQDSIASGCNQVLIKPIRKQQLLYTIRSYLADQKDIPRNKDGTDTIPSPKTMGKLAQFYFSDMKSNLLVYERALNQGDIEAIQSLAHQMKGTGTSYGFKKLTEIGSLLEQAAKENKNETIRTLLQDMSAHLDLLTNT